MEQIVETWGSGGTAQLQNEKSSSAAAQREHTTQLRTITVKEVKSLDELFRKLSSSIVDDGFINREEFQLGLFRNNEKRSLLAQKMFELFDSKHDGVIDFGEFVRSLSIVHPNTPQEEKAIYIRGSKFRRDGKIEIEEWKDFVARKPSLLENMMTVPYLKELTTAFPSFVLRSEKEEEIVG